MILSIPETSGAHSRQMNTDYQSFLLGRKSRDTNRRMETLGKAMPKAETITPARVDLRDDQSNVPQRKHNGQNTGNIIEPARPNNPQSQIEPGG